LSGRELVAFDIGEESSLSIDECRVQRVVHETFIGKFSYVADPRRLPQADVLFQGRRPEGPAAPN